MTIDKNHVRTQDEMDEEAPIDQVEDRVEATMKELSGAAKKRVGDGLQDEKLAREGDELQKEGEAELKKAKEKES
jgi:uncharacterized protein YjbJ (UPF0337 family)